ncbi:ABC transporter ATP-binding protein [Paraliobacillus sp. JSM ZJ581]|uniref:ABC transporter ATP-binding protein n=1 Tax=Paraliobacillus sp. JSM ZJ581 TaxID=3342118 RepID=UPI0035A8ABDC
MKINDAVLEFNNVSFSYPQSQHILDKLAFRIKPGEFVSIIGASGTGKSTIFRLIVGLEQPTKGSIYLNGVEETNRLGKLGYMPQKDLLLPWRNVLENVALPLETENRKYDKGAVLQQLEAVGLGRVHDKYPNELSGGMRQRVSFLRASQAASDLLLLDEPFSALDAMTKLHMQEWLLTQWNQTETSIVFITHDIAEALFLSDKIFVIREAPIQMVEEIEVPLKRPRQRQQLDTPQLIELKNELMNLFNMQVIR